MTMAVHALQALYQPQGGILASEKCIEAHVEAALQSRAELHTEERMLGWQVLPSGMVEVATTKGAYQAVKLVLTAGAWMPQIVPQLQVLCSPFVPPPDPTILELCRLSMHATAWLLETVMLSVSVGRL